MVVDQVAGAQLATRHLLDLGHETVLHVRGPADWMEADARERGWRAELGRVGAKVLPPLAGDWSAASGYRAGLEIVSRTDVSAVFAGNDQMSLGILRALQEAGRSVPHDISIVGFDDIPEAEFFHVPLTTVRQDFAEAGRRCVERLLAVIGDRTPPGYPSIQPELAIRASTAAPKGA